MGASQSSKSQLSAQRVVPIDASGALEAAAGGCGQQQQARHKLGASLRKSVNSALASGKSQFQKQASPTKGRKEILAHGAEPVATNGSLHNHNNGCSSNANGNNQTDSYYVSHRGNNFTAIMNNYVTMQQQQQQLARPMTLIVSSGSQISAAAGGGGRLEAAACVTGTQLDQGTSYDGNNRQNGGVYGNSKSSPNSSGGGFASASASASANFNSSAAPAGGNIYAIEPTAMVESMVGTGKQILVTNRDGSLNGGNTTNSNGNSNAQDTHNNLGLVKLASNGVAAAAANATSSRSQQQRQLHQTPTATPFQLSRAVNTRTISALSNTGASTTTNTTTTTTTTNSTTTNAVAMPKSHGRHKHQQQYHHPTSNGHPLPSASSQPRAPLANNSFATSNGASQTSNEEPTVASMCSQMRTTPNNKSPPSQYQHQASAYQIGASSNKSSPSSHRPPAPSAITPNAAAHLYYADEDEALENHHHQHHHHHHNPEQHQRNQFYTRNLLDAGSQLNGGPQPQQQVSYKYPQQQQQQQQQQYQYANPNPYSAIDFHQATYNNSNTSILHPSYQGSPFVNSNPKQQQQQQPLQLDCHNYNRSYSFGSSRTLEVNRAQKKSLNPLVSMFRGSQTSSTPTTRKHSNTISLAKHRSNNKSSANINSNANSINHRSFSGSLKRIKSAPLTAQQASYEAMRTIDMYMIRQIARSCMDFEMEQKIDLEIRLRELAAQSMLEARTEIDVLEVEKSLLTSDQRMNCYASQLEQQRKQLSNPSLSTDSGRGSKSGHRQRSDVVGAGSSGSGNGDTSSPSFSSPSNSQSPSKLSPVSGQSANSPSSNGSHSNSNSRSHSKSASGAPYTRYHRSSSTNTLNRAKNRKREQLMQSITSLSNINCNTATNNRASVSVSEIRIPLMWRDVDHFKGRGDYKRFAIFCLLKIDSQIYDTQLISDVDRQVTDVTFDDMVLFNEIGHNFELTLEVYSCVYLEQFSLSSTPRKLKEKLTSSVSRAMGRRLATQTASANYTKELQAYDKSYRFAMIASATLRLEDASDSVKTYDLVLVSPSAHHRNYPMYSSGNNNNNQSQSTITAQGMTLSNTKEVNKNTLPLFGHFCCKLSIRPDVFDKGIKTGYLKVATINVPISNSLSSDSNNTLASSNGSNGYRDGDSPPSSGGINGYDTTTTESASKLRTALAASSKMATLSMSSSTVHWGLLRNFALHLWPIDEQRFDYSAIIRGELPQLDDPRRPPITLNIDKYTRLLRVSNSSLTLETSDCCFVLGTYCPDAGLINQADEISHWLRAIEQQIYDSHIWGSVLNHYPPHIKQLAAEGGRGGGGGPPTQVMRNLY